MAEGLADWDCFEGFTNVYCLVHLIASRVHCMLQWSSPPRNEFCNSQQVVLDRGAALGKHYRGLNCHLRKANLAMLAVVHTLETMARASHDHRLWTCLNVARGEPGQEFCKGLKGFAILYQAILNGESSDSTAVSSLHEALSSVQYVNLSRQGATCWSTAAESTVKLLNNPRLPPFPLIILTLAVDECLKQRSLRTVGGAQQAAANSRPTSFAALKCLVTDLCNKLQPSLHNTFGDFNHEVMFLNRA